MPTDQIKVPNQLLLGLTKNALRAEGIRFSVYSAVSTDSKYLRLDKGILGSLRIGDHPGKKKFHYTYEIGSHIKEVSEKKHGYLDGEFTQYKFPANYLEELILQIKIERANKIARYSKEQYEVLVKTSSR